MPRRSWVVLLAILAALSTQGSAQQQPPEATPQRPTFTEDTNITVAGTVELELGVEGNQHNFGFPTTWKFTPSTLKAELTLGYNSLMVEDLFSRRVIKFTDRVMVGIRKPVWQKGPMALAVSGELTKFYLDDRGIRGGGTIHANWSGKRAGLVINETLIQATNPSVTNPHRLYDTAATLTINLPAESRLGRLTPFASALDERGSKRLHTTSTMYGTYIKIHPNCYVDGSIRLVNIVSGVRQRQVVIGFARNLGRL